MSDGIVRRPEIGLERSLRLLEAVRREAAAEGIAVAAAVTDRGGHVVASARMDDAALGAMRLAVDKAYTAVLWQTPTGEFMASTQPGGDDWGFTTTSGGRIVVYAGGLPIWDEGVLCGALGVSGGTAAQDEACATRALAAVGLA
ncbi:MAG: GlcG/HbpS family heme-binding protein [Gaiellales bacterium]